MNVVNLKATSQWVSADTLENVFQQNVFSATSLWKIYPEVHEYVWKLSSGRNIDGYCCCV